jgi:TolB protein
VKRLRPPPGCAYHVSRAGGFNSFAPDLARSDARSPLPGDSAVRFAALSALLTAGLLASFATSAPAPKGGPPRLLVVASNKGGNWDVYLVQPGTGETKNLTDHKAADTEPVWSPDGKKIAFVSDRDGSREIWLMNADGTAPKQLTKGQIDCSNLRWSPDGSRIAFVAPKANRGQVHTVDVAGGKVVQLTNGTVASRQPAWSPDGKKLSYSYYAGRYSTYVMNADGGEKTKLTDANGGLDAAWSPDGSRVAFAAISPKGGWQVFTITPDGKRQQQLTDKPNNEGNVYPQWSPDGSRISYGVLVDNVFQVAVVNANGTGAKVITSKQSHVYSRWSPDGKSISYTRFEAGKPAALWVSDPDGENAKELMTHVGQPAAEWKPK